MLLFFRAGSAASSDEYLAVSFELARLSRISVA